MQNIINRLVVWIGGSILKSFDFLVEKCTPDKDVYDSNRVIFDALLKEHMHAILLEYEAVRSSRLLNNVEDFYKVETEIGQDENWKVYPFMLFNHHFEKNLAQCPNTKNLLQQIPACTSAMFSVLHPHKHIIPHQGLYKGIVRCLFTLEAPADGSSWIMINGTRYPFKRGESIYFDETFIHEVKNESGEYRVALYMDIYRTLPFPLNIFNRLIFKLLQISPFVAKRVEEYRKLTQTGTYKKQEITGYKFL